MKKKMKDRRIEKTRKALHEALVSLMAKKKYERIVVQDILDRANVGRSTFYLHYSDKDELLLDGIDRLWETLRQAQAAESGAAGKHERVIKFSLEWFRHTYGHRDLFKLLVGTPGWDIVRRRMEEMLIHLIKEEARPLYKKRTSSDDFELFAYFLGSGFVSVMTWWLNQKRPLPPEEIDVLFRQLVLPILSARLNY